MGSLGIGILLAFALLPGRSHGHPHQDPGDGTTQGEQGELKSPARSPRSDRKELEARIDKGIRQGLKYLAARNIENGKNGLLDTRYSLAVTSLAGLAFLGAGEEYLRGPHGQTVHDLVYYVTRVATQEEDTGFIVDSDPPSRMHGHAYAMLFLTQVLGNLDSPQREQDVRTVVRRGIDCILKYQTPRGGWGYTPEYKEDEASLTVCCLQALRAAHDAGFRVEKAKIDHAVRYLKDCAQPDGSFRYSLAGHFGNRTSYELTAAAVSTLDAAGQYTGDVHARGVNFMLKMLRSHKRRPLDACQTYHYYGNLYVAQVFFQMGGEAWDDWYPAAAAQLLDEQQSSGKWTSRYGDAYATATALLILEVPRGYLPIFER